MKLKSGQVRYCPHNGPVRLIKTFDMFGVKGSHWACKNAITQNSILAPTKLLKTLKIIDAKMLKQLRKNYLTTKFEVGQIRFHLDYGPIELVARNCHRGELAAILGESSYYWICLDSRNKFVKVYESFMFQYPLVQGDGI